MHQSMIGSVDLIKGKSNQHPPFPAPKHWFLVSSLLPHESCHSAITSHYPRNYSETKSLVKKEEYPRQPRAEQRGEMILQIEMIDIVV